MTRRKSRTPRRRRTGNWKLKYASIAAGLLAVAGVLFMFRADVLDAWQRKSILPPPAPVVKTIYKAEDRQKLDDLFDAEVKQ